MLNNIKKIPLKKIEKLFNAMYDSEVVFLYGACVSYPNGDLYPDRLELNNLYEVEYLVISRDNDNDYSDQFIVNSISIQVNQLNDEKLTLIDHGAMPNHSASTLKEAKIYINDQVQEFKKSLLNEKLTESLAPKSVVKKLKI